MVCVTVYRQQVSCKLSTDLLQVDCQNLLSTGWLQVVSTSCNKPDFSRQLDEIGKGEC